MRYGAYDKCYISIETVCCSLSRLTIGCKSLQSGTQFPTPSQPSIVAQLNRATVPRTLHISGNSYQINFKEQSFNTPSAVSLWRKQNSLIVVMINLRGRSHTMSFKNYRFSPFPLVIFSYHIQSMISRH